ncbi:unnamed protein product [Rhizoctonia solani]|uniref:Uncharacterized protein n=1 Tax=Rhizoctonia solani TaxID=456999 RepID=A0A8H2X162_9AGAM|nr:unnamed protein product [Rhizoctonia solani]
MDFFFPPTSRRPLCSLRRPPHSTHWGVDHRSLDIADERLERCPIVAPASSTRLSAQRVTLYHPLRSDVLSLLYAIKSFNQTKLRTLSPSSATASFL